MKRIYLLALFIFVYLFSALPSLAEIPQISGQHMPKREVRAVWLTTIGGLDWPHSYAQSSRSIDKQQQELRDILNKLQQAGINTVLLQTRVRGTMIYPSAYEPWDGCLSGMPGKGPGYDALQFAIDECHRRGMELHAWVVTMPIGKWNGLGCRELHKKHPNLIRRIGAEGYMNPEVAGTAGYMASICEEITRNYDVDGIHLDYIRYPETWNIRVSREQGRSHITNIVKAIRDRVKMLKPWVKMSCSPIGKFDDLSRYWSHGWNAYTKVCQDAQGWLQAGLMDELFPMMYFLGDQFYPFAIDWAEESHGRIVAPGLGIYFMSPREKNWPLRAITQQMHVLRQYGLGHAYFRSKFFTDNEKGIFSFASTLFDHTPALVPAMTWEHSVRPDAPTAIYKNTKTSTLSWHGAKDRSNGPYLTYNIYGSNTYPVDIENANNLLLSRVLGNSVKVPLKEYIYYAVTAMDRYGNESDAIQQAQPMQAQAQGDAFLRCDGMQLELPAKASTLDADLVTIETLQGCAIATRRYAGKTINVSGIADGVYILRSINKKGYTHRLGRFVIRRNKAGL